MNIFMSVTRKRMFLNILSIVVMLAMAFPVAGSVLAQDEETPNPFLVAAITQHWMWAYGFHPETMVTISVYETKDSPDPVVVISRQSNEFGNVEIQGWEYDWDLETGNYMVATDGTITDSLLMDYVTLDVFVPEEDLVKGHAVPGREVSVGVGNGTGEQWMNVFADEHGVWSADFTLPGYEFDITEDSWAGGHVGDEDGDVTVAHNTGPALGPRFVVFPEWDFFDGLDWPDGATVTITVAGKPQCEASKESWEGFFNGNFGDGCNIETGDIVTFTYGTITRTHTVQNLAVTNADAMTNVVAGVADPVAVIDVWIHETGQQDQTTATNGNWQVDFTDQFDLVVGTCGRSQITVGVNATAVDWCAPKPWMIAFPENEAVEGWEWPEGATVTLSIDNAPEGFERSGIAEVTTWGDPRTYVRFDFWEEYNLQAGDVVTLTDGTISRTYIVQNLSVTDVNADTDTLSGMADPGVVVTMWPHGYDQIATLQTTAGEDGAWTGEFASVGFNLVPGIGGRSEVGDEFGNWTAVDWGVYMDGWQQINESGLGNLQNASIAALEVFQGKLYAGAINWDAGGQIWRLEQNGQWLQVIDSGFGSGSASPAVIDLAVFQGKLYAGLGWNYETPGQIWRSANGTDWQPITVDGFGNDGNIAVTNFVVYKGMLYAGTGGTDDTSAQIWRSSTGDVDDWTQVAPDDFELTGNVTGFSVYKGVLYAAIEPPGGVGAPMQVWRSTNGRDWVVVTSDGFGVERNESTGGFAQFDGYLYLGIQNEDTGAQLWRTADGMYWEQVVDNGFGDLNNIKIEALLVYEDYFYAATKNIPMGMQLWRSVDGLNWEQVAANGFGDGGNFATLWNSAIAQYQGNIVVGTWNYNEGGEVWLYTP